MALYTSAQAAKLLRKWNEEYTALLDQEIQSRSFVAAVGEDAESVRPAYDYAATQRELAELEQKIRALKHQINQFNVTHVVPGFDMTVDALLVYIPQLTRRKSKLAQMRGQLPKVREGSSGRSNIIDYRYTNYDVAEADADYHATVDELARAQTALDLVNSTETFEIDL